MRFENYLLRAVFVACMVLCFATLGSMLFSARPGASTAAAETGTYAAAPHASALAPLDCQAEPEGTPCARMD